MVKSTNILAVEMCLNYQSTCWEGWFLFMLMFERVNSN